MGYEETNMFMFWTDSIIHFEKLSFKLNHLDSIGKLTRLI